MKIVTQNNKIFKQELKKMSVNMFGDLVKGFDSMINLRPTWGNRSRGVDNEKIQEKIKKIVNSLIE